MIILASASPRRKELLHLITDEFIVIPPQKSENMNGNFSADYLAAMLATQKAKEISEKHPEDIVIGADTVVEVDGCILGKPKNEEEARAHLTMLSGKTHSVHTGVCICRKDTTKTFAVTSSVTFAVLTEKEISDYIATTEPLDKAGSYGIQGYGAKFIEHIRGDFYSVMGLPIHELYKHLKHF